MKKTIFLVMLFLFMTSNAVYAVSSITMYDGISKNDSGWYGKQEDQEVEPGCITGQVWDLEGFFQDGNNLLVSGGFNFKDGYRGITSGDVFFDVDGNAQYGPSNDGTGYGNGIVSNTFGYDYVADLDFVNMKYSIYSLADDARTWTIGERINQESNPWRYYDGGQALLGYSDLDLNYWSGLSDVEILGLTDMSLQGGTHYAFSLDLSFLDAGTDFISHYTIGCGNDNLMGQGSTPVPEPASLLLLATGIIGFFRFRKN